MSAPFVLAVIEDTIPPLPVELKSWVAGETYLIYEDGDSYVFGCFSWLRGEHVFHAQVFNSVTKLCACTCEAFEFTKGSDKMRQDRISEKGCKHLKAADMHYSALRYERELSEVEAGIWEVA